MSKAAGWLRRLRPCLIPFCALLAWQGAAMLADHPLFPSPAAVLLSLKDCWQPLGLHLLFSAGRLIAGLLPALCIGMPLGLLLVFFPRADRYLSGLLYLLGTLPKAALLPLLLLALGVGEASKAALVFLILFFPLVLAVRDALREIPPVLFEPYRAAGLSGRRMLLDIALPACLPALFTVLRNGLAAGISILFLAEAYGIRYGMGFFIMDMWVRLEYDRMLLGIFLFGGFGFVLCRLTDRIEKRLCPGKKQDRTGEQSD